MRLQVEVQNKAAAIEVLNETPPSIPFSDGVEYLQPQCSRCGSADLELRPMTNIWVCGACGACGMIVEDDDDSKA